MAPIMTTILAPRLCREILLRLMALLLAPSVGGVMAAGGPKEFPMKIRLTVEGRVATATLYDNASARDFATQLPMSLTLKDYATIERIAYPPRKLSIAGVPAGMKPEAGDINYYAPWGNLAIFLSGNVYARGLVPLGKVDSGLQVLRQPGSFKVTIERIDE